MSVHDDKSASLFFCNSVKSTYLLTSNSTIYLEVPYFSNSEIYQNVKFM